MSTFDTAPEKTGDNFVRHNRNFLKMVFGKEEMTPLWVADMDFAIADPIKNAMLRIANRGQFCYEFNAKGVFAAISGWYERRHGLTLNPDNFEQVTGVLTAVSMLIRELTEAGDSVLMQVPAYHQFGKVISGAGREVVKSVLRNTDGVYEMDFDDLEEKLRAPDVKAMILCNPHNPVGRVWREDELARLAALAATHGVTIISDEIQADIIYSGHKFTSLMAVDAANHVAVIGSPAKTFGLHSISNGYVYTENVDILERFKKTADSMYLTHSNAFTLAATVAAYEEGDAWVDELIAYLEGTVNWIDGFLKEELPAIKMSPVEGTYQVWLDCSATGLEGDALKAKLSEAGFGATPGTWFDQEATRFIRVNIAAPRADIEAAFKQFKTVIDSSGTSDCAPAACTPKSDSCC
ncbi:MalY/PatB family protein [Leisingera sp. M523]|uniref:MalY/PatB family protein n=1 Tax=Leisingera sp. M523 TaxID=2867013 RepID=UPI0021A751CF|nr:aminotransferase class I/II-fold pyridoxal phosphate-dependent enzyme [Leisingera sp. M523]UWQ29298.1 aminotransferase class I/II-fold pyridoxal phosphate-dependent enzyme [Leisingera sp. M523]